jgi:bifunctional N-acetylglutamate synthase/kinase
MMEPEIIQRFLESVGQKADVDLYLKLFRAQRKESFAILAAGAQIVKSALDPVHFDLRILTGLGLVPSVVLGLFEPKDADRQAQRVQDWLVEDAVPARIVPVGAELFAEAIEAVRAAIGAGEIPLVTLEGAREATIDKRFKLLATLAQALETRKVVFLSRRAGLEPQGGGRHLDVVNLATDYDRLMSNGGFSRGQATLLRHAKGLVEQVPQRMTATVVNPLQLLRELFTVNGAGTLIRRGSRIDAHPGWDGLDEVRVRSLFESAFGRPLRAGFFADPVERIYLEEGFRGTAVVRQTKVAPYLTKFAVDRQAQGEGIGTELWSMLARDFPTFFWRSRPANPITPWYVKQCDGLARFPEWHVFWRGLPVSSIEAAIEHARTAPVDLD